MKSKLSFLFAVYVIMTVYAMSVVYYTTLGLGEVLPAVLVMWALFLVFRIGVNSVPDPKKRDSALGESEVKSRRIVKGDGRGFEKWALLLALGSATSAVLVTQVTVGVGPGEAVSRIRSGGSAYAEYQAYEASLGVLGRSQTVPLILLMLYIQAVWMYSGIRLVVMNQRLKFSGVMSLGVMGLSAVYPAFARGTTFEAFKVGAFIGFLVWARSRRWGGKAKVRFGVVLSQIVLVLLGVQLFLYNVAARGLKDTPCMTRDVCVDYSSGDLGPMTRSFQWLYNYFGHGFHYVSVAIDEVWLANFTSFFGGLLPLGLVGGDGGGIRSEIVKTIDIGVMWHPDVALMSSWIGVLGLAFFTYLLGRLFGDFARANSIMALMAMFLISLQMISFPVGNFIMVAIDYVALSMVLFFWYVNSRLRTRRPSLSNESAAWGILK